MFKVLILTCLLCAVFQTSVASVICPDHKSECPTGNTCCMLASGSYGCCPSSKAVCCSDHIHCCPQGYKCNVSSGSCSIGLKSIPLQKKTLAKTPAVTCPDGSTCSSGTCCLLSSGNYGCCPFSQAVCCSDHIHCCPSGYKCQVSSGTCSKGLKTVPWQQKTLSKPKAPTVTCPDGSTCASGTCCRLSSGGYGCCPFSSAVCCSDNIHCCPSGYKCQVSSGTCSRGSKTIAAEKKKPAEIVPKATEITCPDGRSCSSSQTCCLLSSGFYGCCPHVQAVCCSDKLHCCPNGMQCDVAHGKCTSQLKAIPWSKKQTAKAKSAVKTIDQALFVMCPDGYSMCPDNTTCCSIGGNKYGCCPLPKAVCCTKSHCCPQKTKCSPKTGQCLVQTVAKLELIQTKLSQVDATNKCSDNKTVCDSRSTCCMLPNKMFGCCPTKSGSCCKDKLHCCPQGYACSNNSQVCKKSKKDTIVGNGLPTLIKDNIPSFAIKMGQKEVTKEKVCPDSNMCPDSSTCCRSTSGSFGCCMLPNAICCSDGLHCCPKGYHCKGNGMCEQTFFERYFKWPKRNLLLKTKHVAEPNVHLMMKEEHPVL